MHVPRRNQVELGSASGGERYFSGSGPLPILGRRVRRLVAFDESLVPTKGGRDSS